MNDGGEIAHPWATGMALPPFDSQERRQSRADDDDGKSKFGPFHVHSLMDLLTSTTTTISPYFEQCV